MHPDDLIHVVLDALAELRRNADDVEPWRWYGEDPDDPKTSETGYLEVLRVADNLFNLVLSNSGGAEALVKPYGEALS